MKYFQPIQKITFIVFYLFFISLSAQEHENSEHQEEEHASSKKHAISFAFSHTHINSAKENDKGSNWIVAPSFGLNYNYIFNPKWAIGLHSDIIIEKVPDTNVFLTV